MKQPPEYAQITSIKQIYFKFKRSVKNTIQKLVAIEKVSESLKNYVASYLPKTMFLSKHLELLIKHSLLKNQSDLSLQKYQNTDGLISWFINQSGAFAMYFCHSREWPPRKI